MLEPNHLYKALVNNTLMREYFDFKNMVCITKDSIILILKHMPAGFVFAGDHVYEILYDNQKLFLICYDGKDNEHWKLVQ